MFALAILLYYSNYSLRSSASIPPNSMSFIWFDSLLIWLIPRFASVKAFTNAAILGSNPSEFSSDGKLNPPSNFSSNSDSNNDSDRLLLLLFPKSGLLFPPPKIPNPSNRFVPIVPKCKKYSPLVLLVPVILFWLLLSSWIASIIIPISGFVKLNIFGMVVIF